MRLTTSSRSSLVGRTPDQVWAVLAAAGTGRHWYVDAAPFLFRGALDRLVGGRPGAVPPARELLEVGDRAGFWRVLRADQGVLELEAEVRAPGTVLLRTAVASDERGYDLSTRITQEVSFHPDGLLGRAYLIADLPAREVLVDLVHRRVLADVTRPPAG
jgi:hypothetical protein